MKSLFLLALLVSGACRLPGQAAAAPKQIFPMELELTRSVHADTLHVGDAVQGRLRAEWSDGACTLPQSSVLNGVVLQVAEAASRNHGLALDFRYRCRGMDAQRLVWLAVLAPDPDVNDPANKRVMGQAVRSASFGGGGGLGSPGNEAVGSSPGKPGTGPPDNLDMSGRQTPTLPVQFAESEAARKQRRPDEVKTGEVWRMPQLHLDVGAGPEGSSLLSSTEKEVKLPLGTVLILLPEDLAVIKPGVNAITGHRSGESLAKRGDFRLSPDNPACIGAACATLGAAMAGAGASVPVTAGMPEKAKRIPPLSLELVHSLNSSDLKVGDEVVAKLQTDWTDNVCRFPAASILHGVVMDIADPRSKRGKLALEFRYRCKGADPQKLVWLALIAPDPGAADASEHRVMRQAYRSATFGQSRGLGSTGIETHIDMAGRQNAEMPVSFPDSEDERKSKRPDAVKTGEVWKMPRLKLDVGAGPEGSTVVSSLDKQVKLPMGTVLILLPESAAVLPAVADNRAPKIKPSPTPKRVTVKLPPEIAACNEPACTNASTPATAIAEPSPLQKISLQKLGYHRLRSAEMRDLEFGAASAFLGQDHLLFAFDPHTLVSREKGDRLEDRPHMVRAVLFNLKSGKAERTVEWRVRGNEQYLWIVDGERVLVHDGDRLRWFGAGLKQEQELKLDGPLSFVRMSPDRKHYAVGTVRELHTKEEHADLSKSDAAGPEEQVRVELLDEHLQRQDEGVASSRALPPVLLDRGRVEMRHAQNGQWYLREFAWVGGEQRDFARMSSSCMPKVKSLSADLVMAEGCNGVSNDHWYRVFREDGSPVLKGVVHWREFSPLTTEDAASGVFAMATPEGGGTYVRDNAFHGTDLSRETVCVHRASDGRKLFETRMRSPLPANQPIAFSPGGERLAVIDGDEIDLYATGTLAPKVAER